MAGVDLSDVDTVKILMSVYLLRAMVIHGRSQLRPIYTSLRPRPQTTTTGPTRPCLSNRIRRSLSLHNKIVSCRGTLSTQRNSITTRATAADDEVPFQEYSPSANAAYWNTRPVTVVKRVIQVSSALGSWVVSGRFGGAIPAERAEKLRRILTDLGPAFIKIGQAVSSRPDVLPPEFLRELEKLQDRLPPFPNDQALAVITKDMDCSIPDVFSYISENPVAAASLGQVYRARLRRDGAEVAVKVQRPGVKTAIALDIFVLRRLAGAIRRVRQFNSDLPALLDEWAASLFRELDYRAEAANGARFSDLYSHLDGVYVPRMYEDLTTSRVLVMEWIDGERLRTAYSAVSEGSLRGKQGARGSSADDLHLVEVGVRCSLEQLLEYGFYHADPHPGNLLRTQDGKLAYLDFGMMGQVDEGIRRGLIRATLHLVNREYEALADDFVTLGMLPKDSDKSKIVPALTGVFAQALAGGVNNLSFGDLSANLGRTMFQFKFQIPSYYTLLVRSLSVLEGIALASDPNYKVLGAAYPWVARRLLTDTSTELRSTLLSLLYKDGKFNFRRMESLLTQAARSTGRPQRRPSDPVGTEPPRGDALALVLSPQGEFVRGIVVEEVAKGLDAAWRLAADAVFDSARKELQTEVLGGVFVGPLARTLVDVLSIAPQLANMDDAEQVEGLRRLAAALQQATAAQRRQETERQAAGGRPAVTSTWLNDFSFNTNGAPGGSDSSQSSCDAFMANVVATAEFLEWALREAETLSPAERAEALRLPLEIGQAVASRVAARAVRWIVVGDSGTSRGTTAEASAEAAMA